MENLGKEEDIFIGKYEIITKECKRTISYKKKCKRNIKFGIEENKFYWENTKMEYSHLIYKIYNNGGLSINFANFSLSHPSHIFSTTVISSSFFFFFAFSFSPHYSSSYYYSISLFFLLFFFSLFHTLPLLFHQPFFYLFGLFFSQSSFL